MIDVNAEAEKTLEALDCTVVYQYPEDFADLPAVSFYTLTERNSFATDNEADIQNGTVEIDVWSKNPLDLGRIGSKVNELMTADDWNREMSRDLPPDGSGVFHKTMRYSKDFYLCEEE